MIIASWAEKPLLTVSMVTIGMTVTDTLGGHHHGNTGRGLVATERSLEDVTAAAEQVGMIDLDPGVQEHTEIDNCMHSTLLIIDD